MKVSLFLRLLEESGLSPEQFAARVGLSGMTLRRWKDLSPQQEIEKFYRAPIARAVYELIQEGRLSADSEVVRSIVETADLVPFEAIIKNLGFSKGFLEEVGEGKSNQRPEVIIGGLSQIGSGEQRKATVEKSRKKILSFKAISQEWSRRISVLVKVIGSRDFHRFEKLAAYGALFYLITPFDLIPDHIPAFGLIDDFAIIGLAVNYYLSRHSDLLK